MGKNVFANGMEIAHKAGAGKVIAAFPDVCLSPPPPPTGPLPVPYPVTSFAKDLQAGSSSVKIGGKPLALKGQSFYKSSPLGNEAATRNFGAAVITHTIVGKTYFQASSMNVMVEGKPVCRHLDITTSNHASYPGSTPPGANLEAIALAKARIANGKCPCCGKGAHMGDAVDVSAPPMNLTEWYGKRLPQKYPNQPKLGQMAIELKQLLADAKARPNPCPTCKSKNTRILPKPPCDVFFPYSAARAAHAKQAWEVYKRSSTYQSRNGIQPVGSVRTRIIASLVKLLGAPTNRQINEAVEADRKVNHLTPKAAGGCPTGGGNLQPNRQLCSSCQALDNRFNAFQ